jgi:hypothetical protein
VNRLNIWSDIPGQWYKASTKSDAVEKSEKDAKAGDKALIEQIESVSDLIELFKRLVSASDVWDTLNFHTHGSGGSIALGSTSLNSGSIEQLEKQGFDRLFSATCVITFEGCNVAEGASGEFFLAKVGDVLLSVNGGKVRGNTGAGLGYWGGDASVHPFGEWITATVGPGGTIRFDKLNHLHPDLINARIAKLALRIEQADVKFQPGDKEELLKCLTQAKTWGVGRWFTRLQSCLWLEKAESKFSEIDMRYARSQPGH